MFYGKGKPPMSSQGRGQGGGALQWVRVKYLGHDCYWCW